MKSGIFKDYSAQDWLTPPVTIISSLGRQKSEEIWHKYRFSKQRLTVVAPQQGEECKAWWDLVLPSSRSNWVKTITDFSSGNRFLQMTHRFCQQFQLRHHRVVGTAAPIGINKRDRSAAEHMDRHPLLLRCWPFLSPVGEARVENLPWRCGD